jgi:serine/threonine-protein kinase
MTEDRHVQQLLDELLDSQSTPEEVCDSCPELLPEVRARWRRMCRVRAELDALFPTPPEPGARSAALSREGTALPRIPGYEVEAVLGCRRRNVSRWESLWSNVDAMLRRVGEPE